jgi:hypothetical protein
MGRYLTEQDKKDILIKSLEMTGSRTEVAKKLSKDYGLTSNTMKKYLHEKYNDDRSKRMLQPDERELIIKAYEQHESEVFYEKVKSLAFKFNRSEATIRSVLSKVKDKPIAKGKEKITYFDPKVFQF